MNTKGKLTLVAIVATKLLILLYISFSSTMPVFNQLVLMPILILETLGLYGYLYECSLAKPKSQTVRIARRIKRRTNEFEMKPAA
ncbi:hypothetical protein FLL45_11410 [Aliikangiella marina]|uniref:Uncharacterized protein n=1 Tax=Aliikangiella marina TaxID=1712262 RepID=A0A545TE66_9GAMM|nr:hypothetical protein [Aliikangiella marina]TQV75515.1 hypothetical protein FLL45_11410 [Aliikangiella marina]